MRIEYKLSAHSYHAEAVCDDGCKGFQEVVVMIAKRTNPFLWPVIWLITRFYKKEVKRDREGCIISYNFYLLHE